MIEGRSVDPCLFAQIANGDGMDRLFLKHFQKRIRQQFLGQSDPLVLFLFHKASKATLSAHLSVANATSVDYKYTVTR